MKEYKIIFVSDTFHHHQKGVADALNALTGKSYRFITTSPLREERRRMGFSIESPEYVLDASNRASAVWADAQSLIDDAEVVVLGSAPYSLLRNRLKKGKLTFRYSERIWKQIKHYLKTPIYILDNLKTRGCYLLCASAFSSYDYNAMGAFKGRCYKWGYFPISGEKGVPVKTDSQKIRLMWCSRFLNWKHPELPVYLSQLLKEKGYSFEIAMYGSGPYLDKAKELALRLGVDNRVLFMGNAENEKIIHAMRRSDIFLFTSDRGEGWGVVANEAMSSGSVLVASDEIGCVPYLVKNRENGCTFKSPSRLSGFNRLGARVDKHSLESLMEQVEWLINNKEERERLAKNAFVTIQDAWNPEVAARNLLTLIDDIEHGRDTSIVNGPCSKA